MNAASICGRSSQPLCATVRCKWVNDTLYTTEAFLWLWRRWHFKSRKLPDTLLLDSFVGDDLLTGYKSRHTHLSARSWIRAALWSHSTMQANWRLGCIVCIIPLGELWERLFVRKRSVAALRRCGVARQQPQRQIGTCAIVWQWVCNEAFFQLCWQQPVASIRGSFFVVGCADRNNHSALQRLLDRSNFTLPVKKKAGKGISQEASWPPLVAPSWVAASKSPEGDKEKVQDTAVNLATCCWDKFVSSCSCSFRN